MPSILSKKILILFIRFHGNSKSQIISSYLLLFLFSGAPNEDVHIQTGTRVDLTARSFTRKREVFSQCEPQCFPN